MVNISLKGPRGLRGGITQNSAGFIIIKIKGRNRQTEEKFKATRVYSPDALKELLRIRLEEIPGIVPLRKKNPSRPPKKSARYVARPSESTRRKPSPRLKKRRARNVNTGYFPNPSAYAVYAKGTDKKMHLVNAGKFSSNGKARRFKSSDEAAKVAYELIEKFPVLEKFKITVEPIGGPPRGK